MVAVILAVPAWFRAVTTPPLTMAMSARSLLHVTAWPAASPKKGCFTARVSDLPIARLRDVRLRVMPDTTSSKSSLRVRAPLVTTTVMVVLPGWFPRVTTPVTGAALAAVDAVTVATLGSELFHSTLSMVASSGISLGVYSQLLPSFLFF